MILMSSIEYGEEIESVCENPNGCSYSISDAAFQGADAVTVILGLVVFFTVLIIFFFLLVKYIDYIKLKKSLNLHEELVDQKQKTKLSKTVNENKETIELEYNTKVVFRLLLFTVILLVTVPVGKELYKSFIPLSNDQIATVKSAELNTRNIFIPVYEIEIEGLRDLDYLRINMEFLDDQGRVRYSSYEIHRNIKKGETYVYSFSIPIDFNLHTVRMGDWEYKLS